MDSPSSRLSTDNIRANAILHPPEKYWRAVVKENDLLAASESFEAASSKIHDGCELRCVGSTPVRRFVPKCYSTRSTINFGGDSCRTNSNPFASLPMPITVFGSIANCFSSVVLVFQ